jgi:hypothetical protein
VNSRAPAGAMVACSKCGVQREVGKRCAPCDREKCRRNYEAHRDERIAYSKQYVANHPRGEQEVTCPNCHKIRICKQPKRLVQPCRSCSKNPGICRKCGAARPINTACKPCAAEYRSKHKQQRREYVDCYNNENKDLIRERKRSYYRANRATVLAKQKIRYTEKHAQEVAMRTEPPKKGGRPALDACGICGTPRAPRARCNPCELRRRTTRTGAVVPCSDCGLPREVNAKCNPCQANKSRQYWAALSEEERRDRTKAYYQNHSAERRRKSREWRHAHLEASHARSAAYRAAHPEQTRASWQAYYAANSDRLRARAVAYRIANLDQYRGYVQKRRARKKDALGSHTVAEWRACKYKHGYKCVDCGLREGKEYPKSAGSAWAGKIMRLTLGHLVPLEPTKANGWVRGSDAIFNIAPQCMRCNNKQRSKIHPSVAAFSLFDQHDPEIAKTKGRRHRRKAPIIQDDESAA